jgi:hypothetical protein
MKHLNIYNILDSRIQDADLHGSELMKQVKINTSKKMGGS